MKQLLSFLSVPRFSDSMNYKFHLNLYNIDHNVGWWIKEILGNINDYNAGLIMEHI